MDKVLIIAAATEAVTGLLLFVAPDLAAGLLLGTDLANSGLVVARVAGISLIALAAACWPGPASLGMLVYGLLVTPYLAWLGAMEMTTGPLLWPAVVVHVVLTTLLIVKVRRGARSDVRA